MSREPKLELPPGVKLLRTLSSRRWRDASVTQPVNGCLTDQYDALL